MEVKEEQSGGALRPGRSQAERSQATREALVGAARKLFAERGFAAVGTGEIAAQPVTPLAHVLMGALDEAAMVVARAEDPEAMRVEVAATLQTLLDGLRLQAPKRASGRR